MLRDAIERKTAKILKEEYGIEPSKEFADKLPKDDQDCENYQIRLTNVGDNKIKVVRVVFENTEHHLKEAKDLVDETHYEEGDDYDDVPASMLDEHHKKFAKPNMPTHWMKMPTHP